MVVIQRHYARNSGEIVQLYSGDSSNLRTSLVFFDRSSMEQESQVDNKVCLDGNKDYNLELYSKNSAAWADKSSISLMYNKIILVNSRLDEIDNGKKIIKFNFTSIIYIVSSLLSSSANWKYSTIVDTASWKENKIEEWGEDYNNKEIKNAGSSVYFRKDITVDDSFTGLQLSVQSQSGFIVYINGIQVSSKNNENGSSTSLEDIPSYKYIFVSKEMLTSVSLSTLHIAIELHTTEDHPEFLSIFDVTYLVMANNNENILNNNANIFKNMKINHKKLDKKRRLDDDYADQVLFDSFTTSITYSYDNINPPEHWTTNLFNDDLWSTVSSSSSLPDIPEDSTTQYYRIHYTTDHSFNDVDRLDIQAYTYAGMILYINGKEIRRINMDYDADIEYDSLATSEYNEYTLYRTIPNSQFYPQLNFIGDNVIAIEIHKKNTIIQPSFGFHVILRYYTSNDIPEFPGEWTANGDVDEEYPLTNLDDYDTETYVLIHRPCAGTILTFTFNDHLYYGVNEYYFSRYMYESLSYSPKSVTFEVYDENSQSWTMVIKGSLSELDTDIDLFSTEIIFANSYRLIINECGVDTSLEESLRGNQAIISNAIFDRLISGGRCAFDNWYFSYSAEDSFRRCEKGYYSDAEGLCNVKTIDYITGDTTCIKMLPTTLYFKETNLKLLINTSYEQYYSIDALDADITVNPSLPSGLTLDNVSKRIYGTPTSLSPATTYTLSFTNDEEDIATYDLSIEVFEPFCSAEGDWPKTESSTTASIPCPIGYTGSISRYCNSDLNWEEPNMSSCVACIGNTYYNSGICTECVNGIITSSNGANIDCTPCNDNEVVSNNECVASSTTCPAKTLDSYVYPETDLYKNAVVNCTNENQYGYYHVLCDYISNIPTWSNDINNDLCYNRPSLTTGKVVQILDYSIKVPSTINNILDLLYSMSQSFIQTYSYQLTDLFLTTNYTSDTNDLSNSLLHVYYGSNIGSYISSSSFTSKIQSYKNDIIMSTESPSLVSNIITNMNSNGYCKYNNDDSQLIQMNTYYLIDIQDESIHHYETYFCKQEQLNYYLIPVLSSTIDENQLIELSIRIEGAENTWIKPETKINIYRSILKNVNIPILNLRLINIQSSKEESIQIITINYFISFPQEISLPNPTDGTWLDKSLFEEKLKNIISIKHTSLITNIISQ
ncbi:hypothetical protein WA158_007889 [Blastocystis sp. Blastoise]